ncbi:MAG: hypothetical protein E7259_08440 [Lachnospiraceae bacterium]|nr:hypothetical protein [Lachnospiraceae bacterium]
MENVWDFFDRVNDNIEIVSALMGIIGVSILGLLRTMAKNREEGDRNIFDMKSIIAVVALLFAFFGMCIYTKNLIVVPQIDNTSYEVAQQMLENKGIKYQVINMS